MKLLNIDANAKTVKGQAQGYLTGILYLAPALSSGWEVCPMRSAGCTAACLNTAGRAAVFKSIPAARKRRTQWYFTDREGFMAKLTAEIMALEAQAARRGLIPVVRLNGTSDILWERVPVAGHPNIMAAHPHLQFYDYTKHRPEKRSVRPANYHLTFSLDERPESYGRALQALSGGWSVAIVFNDKPPEAYKFRANPAVYQVVNGDKNDLRFLDPPGVLVGLKAKGKARQDTSGFVYPVNP